MMYSDLKGMNVDWNSKLDDKLNNAVNSLLNKVSIEDDLNYTVADLCKKVNSDETLEEYIRDTEETFNLERKDLKTITDKELNSYVNYLDSLW